MATWTFDRPAANFSADVDTNGATVTAALANSPADFAVSISAVSIAVEANAVDLNDGTGNDNYGLSVRIMSGTTVLASDTGGTNPQTVQAEADASTFPKDFAVVNFNYVKTDATDTEWDAAVIEYTQSYSKDGGPDGDYITIAAGTNDITVTYTAINFDKTGTAAVSGTGTVTVTKSATEAHSGTAAVSGTGSITVTVSAATDDYSGTAAVSGTGVATASGFRIQDAGIRVGFGLPGGVLEPGPNRQRFRLQVRRSLNGTDLTPTMDVWLYEGGVQRAQLLSNYAVTNDASEIVDIPWTASVLTFQDGRDVEVRIETYANFSSGSGRGVELGAVEWAAAATSNINGTASVSGTGTVTASISAVEFHSGTATVSGSGSVTASGVKGAEDSAAITVAGTVTATGFKGAEDVATITVAGTVTSSGFKNANVNVDVSGSATVTAAYTTAEHKDGTAAVSGTGSVTVTGEPSLQGSGTCTGTGTVTVIPLPQHYQSASVSGSGSITTTYESGHSGVATVSGVSTVTGTFNSFQPNSFYPPNIIITNIGWKGQLSDIDESPSTPDTNWLEL